MSGFSDILEKFKQFDKGMRDLAMHPILEQKTDEKLNAEGNYNRVYFREVGNVLNSPTPLKIALSIPKYPKGRSIHEAAKSREVMRRCRVRSPFILPNLYSDKESKKINLKLKDNLEDYLEREKHLTLDKAKKMMGQLVLAVYALHARNVVHRDLSPNNLFITEKDDLCLGDIETAAEVYHDTGKIKLLMESKADAKQKTRILRPDTEQRDFFLTVFSSPELVEAHGRYQKEDGSYDLHDYYGHLHVDVRIAEIYALGEIINLIVNRLPWIDRIPFQPLILRSTNRDPEFRSDIVEIMYDTVWGKTPEARGTFFEKLTADAIENQKGLFSGSFALRSNPDEEDAFNFMAPGKVVRVKGPNSEVKEAYVPGMKDIYAEFERLRAKIKTLSGYDEEGFKFPEKKEDKDVFPPQIIADNEPVLSFSELEATRNNMEVLYISIDKRLKFLRAKKKESTEEYPHLNTLKTYILDEVAPCLNEAIKKYIASLAAVEFWEEFPRYQEKINKFEKGPNLLIMKSLNKSEESLFLFLEKLMKFSSENKLDASTIKNLRREMQDFYLKYGKVKERLECLVKEFDKLTEKGYELIFKKFFLEGDVFAFQKIKREANEILSLMDGLIESDPENEEVQEFLAFKPKAQEIMRKVINPIEEKYVRLSGESLYIAVRGVIRECINKNKLGKWSLGREYSYKERTRASDFLKEFEEARMQGETFDDLVKRLHAFTAVGDQGEHSINAALKRKTESFIVEIQQGLKWPVKDNAKHLERVSAGPGVR